MNNNILIIFMCCDMLLLNEPRKQKQGNNQERCKPWNAWSEPNPLPCPKNDETQQRILWNRPKKYKHRNPVISMPYAIFQGVVISMYSSTESIAGDFSLCLFLRLCSNGARRRATQVHGYT
jgi:hypothetical protein